MREMSSATFWAVAVVVIADEVVVIAAEDQVADRY